MIQSDRHLCVTNVLYTPGHNDLEMNQWDVYDSARVLGECAEFLLNPPEEGGVRVRFVNGGSGGHCAHLVNLQADYLTSPHLTCSAAGGRRGGVWSDGGVGDWLHCRPAPAISRVDVHTCLSDYAGTDSPVRC